MSSSGPVSLPANSEEVSVVGVAVFPEGATTTLREGYRALLTRSRDMRRDHAIARDAWFAGLKVERKAELLFELEVVLKGLACFANPRNHSGPPRRIAIVAIDFREPLLVAKEGLARAIAITRKLLDEQERVFVFHRYLEHVIPEDGARTRFVRASSTQETPEDALLALRHGFTNVLEIVDALLRAERVPYRTFYAALALVQREVARNSFFNPIAALEFRPEFDRIERAELFDLVQSVQGDEAHRLVALTFLSLFRMLRYLSLAESLSNEQAPSRAFLAFAALRSDARALSSYLRRHAGHQLSEGFDRELFAVSARAISSRYETLLADGHRLLGIKGALEAIAAKLRLEMRRSFERDLPPIEAPPPPLELRRRISAAVDGLRPSIQSTIMFLTNALGSRLDAHFVFDDDAAKRDVGERLRRDVWMFAQIVRGFTAKASALPRAEKTSSMAGESWAGVESFRFVKEFLSYFRAMGYPLLRASDYPRFDEFLDAMASLEETDLVDPNRLQIAITECEKFNAFLTDLFDSISRREELAGSPFDKRAAAESLRLYLGV